MNESVSFPVSLYIALAVAGVAGGAQFQGLGSGSWSFFFIAGGN